MLPDLQMLLQVRVQSSTTSGLSGKPAAPPESLSPERGLCTPPGAPLAADPTSVPVSLKIRVAPPDSSRVPPRFLPDSIRFLQVPPGAFQALPGSPRFSHVPPGSSKFLTSSFSPESFREQTPDYASISCHSGDWGLLWGVCV